MKTFLIKMLLVIFICMTKTAFSQDLPSFLWGSDSGKKDHCRVAVRHIEGGGIGYNQGYTTFEGFFAPAPDQVRIMPFLDLRGHVFNDGYVATNVGIGFRSTIGSRIYGFNGFYDSRDTQGTLFNQIGFGLETLGKLQDFRVNGYLPVGKKTVFGPAQFAGFLGHNLILSQDYTSTMKGADAELGFHFEPYHGFYLYPAIGPYYYKGEMGGGFWGGKARLKGNFGQYLALEVSDSYDSMFHNKLQLQLTLTMPLARRSDDMISNNSFASIYRSRMVQSVNREEIIVVEDNAQRLEAIDPITGQPLFFIFVDNTSHSLGTFESPYPTLALAQANSQVGDIIYVYPGDGTTTGMNRGITLKNSQKFWGTGIQQQVITTQGNITIPALSASAPQITNTLGDGITLAANNQISGFIIKNVMNNGIVGLNPQNIQVLSTTIDSSQADHIHLQYTSPGGIDLNKLTLINGNLNAIYIDSTATSIVGSVTNSIFNNNAVFTLDASFTETVDFNVIDNSFVDNINGLFFNFNGPSTLFVSGNTFTNTISVSSAPVMINAGVSPISVDIENNIISNNVCGAIRFELSNTNPANLTITQNTITNNGTGSEASLGSSIVIIPNMNVSGNSNLTITDNIISENAGSALYINTDSFNDLNATINDNQINNNGKAGMVFAASTNSFTLIGSENTITNSGDNGISIIGATMTTVAINLSNNLISGSTNAGNGIVLSNQGNNLLFSAINNVISDNEGSGILLYSSTVIENVVLNIENNNIINNQNIGSNTTGGIDFEQFTNLSGNVMNNVFTNNVGQGVFVGSTEPSPSVCLTMIGNSSDTGYELLNDVDGIFNLAPLNVNAVNIGAINTIGTITLIQSCP